MSQVSAGILLVNNRYLFSRRGLYGLWPGTLRLWYIRNVVNTVFAVKLAWLALRMTVGYLPVLLTQGTKGFREQIEATRRLHLGGAGGVRCRRFENTEDWEGIENGREEPDGNRATTT